MPVHKDATSRYARLREIPNPYHSESAADSIGSTCLAILGEALCYFVGDWVTWLSFRIKPDCQLRFGGVHYREITDAELEEGNNDR
ncbi:hypothetical protein [Paraburkholderia caffeinilytica]|uniref:hypothetical protein n=1 Tax=Paraburkholderia caffeinilytica TaxID=1761016 RepID=UPI003DA0F584